jgi:hypothetical protein
MSIYSFHNDEKTLIRFVAFSPIPVNGFFKYKDILQIFSLPDEAPKPEYAIGDHPLIVEYIFDSINQTANTQLDIDDFDSRLINSKYSSSKQDEIICLLSVISKYQLTKDYPARKWVVDDTKTKSTLIWGGTGYFWEGLSKYKNSLTDISINKMPLIHGNEYYKDEAFLGEDFTLCESTAHLLNKYFALDEKKKEAFLSACVLFTQSSLTWKISHSLAYVGFVSSIESLIEYDYRNVKIETCSCGQKKFNVSQKFREFMQRYGEESIEYEKYVNKLYKRRSAIGHKGKLLSNDIVGKVIGLHDDIQDSIELKNLQKIVRISLINWLLAIK